MWGAGGPVAQWDHVCRRRGDEGHDIAGALVRGRHTSRDRDSQLEKMKLYQTQRMGDAERELGSVWVDPSSFFRASWGQVFHPSRFGWPSPPSQDQPAFHAYDDRFGAVGLAGGVEQLEAARDAWEGLGVHGAYHARRTAHGHLVSDVSGDSLEAVNSDSEAARVLLAGDHTDGSHYHIAEAEEA
jgi:hypothetical protein